MSTEASGGASGGAWYHGPPSPPASTPSLGVRGEWLPGSLHAATTQVALSRYREVMAKQTTVRLPEDLADDAEAVARVKGTSVNALIIDALKAEIERVRQDNDFTSRAERLLGHNQSCWNASPGDPIPHVGRVLLAGRAGRRR